MEYLLRRLVVRLYLRNLRHVAYFTVQVVERCVGGDSGCNSYELWRLKRCSRQVRVYGRFVCSIRRTEGGRGEQEVQRQLTLALNKLERLGDPESILAGVVDVLISDMREIGQSIQNCERSSVLVHEVYHACEILDRRARDWGVSEKDWKAQKPRVV